MKCLSRIEIQEYLDKELDPLKMKEISFHLEKCERCSQTLDQALADKIMVKNLLSRSGDIKEKDHVPDFIPPVIYRKKNSIYRFIPYIAAASIIGLLVLFRPGKTHKTEYIPEAEILLYQYYDGQDLNKMWHEKSQIIILQDEKGNIIQSIITN